ncbi:MAG TPA: class I adenylate-forming enzyme family protein [Candidatus Limnocylindrales bacterium]|nr:class I adenylate-forming enzyme family protein [Candidatus Limnocylindrales bacterium]
MNIFETICEQARPRMQNRALVQVAPGGHVDTRTYGELIEAVRARALELEAAGIGRAWRVGMIAPQGIEFIETALAILAAGACMVPVADDHPPATVAELARRAHLHALLAEEMTLSSIVKSCPGHFTGRSEDDPAPSVGAARLQLLGTSVSTLPAEAQFAALGPAYLRFTSGTTSERKGVVIGHARIHERLAAANKGLAIAPEDRVLWLLPMAHHFVVSILLYLRYGATILLPPSSLAPAVLELAEREQATVLYASPYHMKLLAKDASQRRLDSMRLIISTAEGLRGDVAETFARRYGRPIVQALGIMEAGLPVMNTASAATKPEALGRPQPDYEIWLRGEDGSRARGDSPETSGEICIRGPGMLDAYLDPWIPSTQILEPDGFRTGDQGWFDADGDLHLVGRRAARINMAGMKFFCEEVEAVLDAHPAIERSRVFATVHPHLGELPAAEIVLAPGAQPPAARDLTAWCRERLAAYMVPRKFDVVASLPLTPTGKLART